MSVYGHVTHNHKMHLQTWVFICYKEQILLKVGQDDNILDKDNTSNSSAAILITHNYHKSVMHYRSTKVVDLLT